MEEALTAMQTMFYNSAAVDWPATRTEAMELIQGAQTSADTYDAIFNVLRQIGDAHGHLIPPVNLEQTQQGRLGGPGYFLVFPERVVMKVYANGPADQAGVREGDLIEAVNGVPTSTMTETLFFDSTFADGPMQLSLRRVGVAEPVQATVTPGEYDVKIDPVARRLASSIGYLEIPNISSGQDATAFAQAAHNGIATVDQEPACGWIVDLRRNTGGNSLAMLAAVGPIVGEGELGAFVVGSERTPWNYVTGRASLPPRDLQVATPYTLKQPDPPVAVLTSRFTNSAGEVTTLAFRGRAEARSFGEPTGGVPTVLRNTELSDKAILRVTVGLYADRTGQTYAAAIPPDESVKLDWTRFGSDDDPVIQAASAWLQQQPACAGR
jgi:C-terminal processing protease CtpA/Prc